MLGRLKQSWHQRYDCQVQVTVASLTDVLTPACEQGYGVAGLVVLGWEDACAYVEAADDLGVPVILQAGPAAGRIYQYLC